MSAGVAGRRFMRFRIRLVELIVREIQAYGAVAGWAKRIRLDPSPEGCEGWGTRGSVIV